MKTVFTAQSKRYFYCRDVVCQWVLEQGALPLNPFRVFEYFLGDRVDRDIVRRGNNNLIRLADELWVFGIVADGVLFEIEYALSLERPIRFFTIATRAEEIREVEDLRLVKFEPEIHAPGVTRETLLSRIGSRRKADPQLYLFGERSRGPRREMRDSNGSAAEEPSEPVTPRTATSNAAIRYSDDGRDSSADDGKTPRGAQ